MRPAVVEHHEFDHRGQASTLVVRRRNQCGLHVWRNPDADDFGFGDGQLRAPVCKTLAVCNSVTESHSTFLELMTARLLERLCPT